MMKLLLVLAVGLWAGTGWAESVWIDPNPCGSVTTAEGRSAQEEAKRYRERHECMMGLADSTTSIEQKLQADKARYEREQEDRGRQIVEDAKERWAYQQWDAVKRECWGQP